MTKAAPSQNVSSRIRQPNEPCFTLASCQIISLISSIQHLDSVFLGDVELSLQGLFQRVSIFTSPQTACSKRTPSEGANGAFHAGGGLLGPSAMDNVDRRCLTRLRLRALLKTDHFNSLSVGMCADTCSSQYSGDIIAASLSW